MTINDLTRNNAELKYPHFEAVLSKVASPEMIKLLEEGECQLIGVMASSGKKALLRKISYTPHNVRKLLMVVDRLYYNLSATVSIPINTVVDYMEVL